MNTKRYKSIIIMILIICVMTISIAYAAFNSRLNIQGTSNISSVWSIKITNAILNSKTGGASEITPITYSDLSANFAIGFETPGDTLKYDITVTNEGTFNAVLDSIKINMTNQEVINFKVEGITSGDVIKPKESTTFTIEFKLDETLTTLPEIKDYDITLDLNYMQEGTSSDFSDPSIDQIGELVISDIVLTPDEHDIKVIVNATNAVKYYYSIDNDKWFESTNNTYTLAGLDKNKDYTIYVKAVDAEGNVILSSTNTKTLINDKEAPTLTLTADGLNANNWAKENITVDIEADDADGIGVSKIVYCTSTTNTCEPDTEISSNIATASLTDEGTTNYVCAKAIDAAGNESDVKCSNPYKIDKTAPVLTVPADAAIYVSDTSFDLTTSVSATDNYTESSNITITNSGNLSLGIAGEYTITYTATDLAGNTVSKNRVITIKHNYLGVRRTMAVYTSYWYNEKLPAANVESIKFTTTNQVPSDVGDNYFDISEAQNGSVMAWFYDKDSDGLYEVTVGQNGGVLANPDSSYLFGRMGKLTSIDVTNLNTSHVDSFERAFTAITTITSLDLNSLDISNATSLKEMFVNCSATTLKINEWDTSNVTDMSNLFGSSSVRELDIKNWDVSNVTNMREMFAAASMETLDLSNWKTSSLTATAGMFLMNSSIKTVYVSELWDNSKVTDSEWMFYGASNIVGAIAFDSSKDDITVANYTNGYFTYKAPTIN